MVIATKGGLRQEGEELLRDSSPAWLRKGLEESLRHLRTDYVDIYQVHWPDPADPFAETAAALEEFVREGKVRHVGASNFDAPQIAEFERTRAAGDAAAALPHAAPRDRGRGPPLLPRARHRRADLRPARARSAERALHARDPPRQDDWRAGSDLFSGEAYERNLRIVERLKELAGRLDITVAQLAIAWTLANPAVHVAIVGARRPAHIEGAAPAAEVHLDEDALARVEEILAQAAMVGGPTPEGV